MKLLVVDDERVARSRLKRMLAPLDDIEVVGEAADGEEALARIAELQPDVVLLDIRMPGMNGIELAHQLPDQTHVIFTTAYDEYAVQAFEAAAVDYLLKPVASERLIAAIDKVRLLRRPAERNELMRMLERLAERRELPRIHARRGDTIRVFDPREITRFHAQDRYTVFRHGGRKFLLDESIVSLEKRLGPWGFLKVHRSELVNLQKISALRREDDVTLVELADGQRAVVSRRSLKALKEHLGIPVK